MSSDSMSTALPGGPPESPHWGDFVLRWGYLCHKQHEFWVRHPVVTPSMRWMLRRGDTSLPFVLVPHPWQRSQPCPHITCV